MTRNEAIHNFWSSFGMPAFRDTSVPHDTPFPYLTYQYSTGAFGKTVSLTVRMWFYTESEALPDGYAERLEKALNRGGAKVVYDNGAVVFSRGNPFCIAQNGQDDNNLKLRYFNINAVFDNEV